MAFENKAYTYNITIFADYFPNATLTKGEYGKCHYVQNRIK